MRLNSLIAMLAATLALCSCGRKNEDLLSQNVAQERAHQWYCFSQTGFEKISLPQQAPKSADRPWTEAVRISSAGSNFQADEVRPDAFAVVNRLGILSFRNGEPSLAMDSGIFPNESAGNLFFENGVPFFTLNKDRTFNKAKVSSDLRPFIVRFQEQSNLCIPLLSCQDFGLDEKSEITDLTIRERQFICSVKTYQQDRLEFTYFAWTPSVPLNTLTATNALKAMRKEEITTEAYRAALAHENISAAPERLQELLSNLPQSFTYSVKCRTAKQNSESFYFHGDRSGRLQSASATIAPGYALAVFADGTTFLSGSLNKRPALNNGSVAAFRLPKLPAGYVYGDAMISQGTLIVAWEEADFYMTGRSGFITVDLDKVLY